MKQINRLCMLLLALAGLSACNTDGSNEVTLYGDAVVTGFSLTDHSTVAFSIDQTERVTSISDDSVVTARRIFNADSLAAGTDVTHLLVSITTMNNGVAFMRDTLDLNTWYYVSTADSINFTHPRLVRVVASDNAGYSDYLITVNVCQQPADTIVWQQTASDWQPSTTTLPQDIAALLGNSSRESYGWTADQQLMVLREGADSYTADLLSDDSDAALLPTELSALTCYPMTLATNTDYLLLAGNSPANAQYGVVWRKIVDYGQGADQARWTYMERTDQLYRLPRTSSLSLAQFADGILAVCLPEGATEYVILQSRDNGITWKTSRAYQLPSDFDHNATGVSISVDSDNNLWLRCAGSGQEWKGEKH